MTFCDCNAIPPPFVKPDLSWKGLNVFCYLCRKRGLKVAKYGSQGQNKEDIRDLVRQAGLVSFGVELPDLYIDLILAGRMRFKEAARVYMISLTEYKMESKAVH